jgi:DNA polymerase-3 subunit gamma/tau
MKKTAENLAVRYRPYNLNDMIGNASVIGAIKAILRTNYYPTASIFYGLTGSGKTTIDRIIARTLNCDCPVLGYLPCGRCKSCTTPLIDHSSIMEINCTVHGKIDPMVKLIGVSILAPRHNHRVFILDELQGASREAINALLKPLEEPPPLTVWVLCTSEFGKIPKPIAGRCMQFALTYPSPQVLHKRLRKIARSEFDPAVAQVLAPYLPVIIEACGCQPRAAIERMGLVGMAIAGNPKAQKNPRLAEKIMQALLGKL